MDFRIYPLVRKPFVLTKNEEVDPSESEDYHDSLKQLGRFLDEVDMHKRIHASLG